MRDPAGGRGRPLPDPPPHGRACALATLHKPEINCPESRLCAKRCKQFGLLPRIKSEARQQLPRHLLLRLLCRLQQHVLQLHCTWLVLLRLLCCRQPLPLLRRVHRHRSRLGAVVQRWRAGSIPACSR